MGWVLSDSNGALQPNEADVKGLMTVRADLVQPGTLSPNTDLVKAVQSGGPVQGMHVDFCIPQYMHIQVAPIGCAVS